MAEKPKVTEEEARTIHNYFIAGTGTYVFTAILAHVLAWQWRPWF
jgi:light-harvesting complex 1 beta chain